MHKLLLGSLAGCAATVPMTMAMEALHRELPFHLRGPLPPRKITVRVARALDVDLPWNDEQRGAASLIAHLAFGGAMGALYGQAADSIPLPTSLAGATFGLAVWAGNYAGALPALGLYAPPHKTSPRRTGLMIGAHLVWGVATAIAFELGRRRVRHPRPHRPRTPSHGAEI